MRILPLALLTVLSAALAVFPAAPPRPAGEDVHDLVILHPKRPYRIRFHLRIAAGSYRLGWNQQIARLFHYLDTNGDGALSKEELRRAPSLEQWREMTSA